MEVKTTIEKLIKDIQDIEKTISRLRNSSHIPQIEIDLVLSRLREAYDVALGLNKSRESAGDQPSEQISPGIESTGDPGEFEGTEKPAETPQPVELGKTVTREAPEGQDFELEQEPETGSVKKEEPILVEERKEEAPEEKTSTDKKPPVIVADRFKDSKKFMNETLAKNMPTKDLSSKLQSKPLGDIGKAIGINDRFLFIKELFDGDSKKFDETINVLNNAPNFNEAFNYLSENFSWNMDDPSVQKLLELARRKLIIEKDE